MMCFAPPGAREDRMGRIVHAAAMSHVLYPDYYGQNVGPHGRVSTLYGERPVPPLVPFWVNCFVAPQPTAQRCFAAGRHIARVIAEGPWDVAVIATGGLSHFPELSLARVGQSDAGFDRRIVKLMEAGDYEPLTALTAKELHESGSHELLNWPVLMGAVSPARARARFFGEMGRIDLAALEWDVA